MNIWLIQTGEPLPITGSVKKMRTALLADKLVQRGHSVFWWASAFDHLQKKMIYDNDAEVEIKKGFKIFALKGTGYKRNISLSRFVDHRIVAGKFRKLAKEKTRPDIIIASMPPHDLAYEAVMFAKENSIPVILDIRDEWPDLFVNQAPSVIRPLIKLFLFNDFMMIREAMKKADSLFAMIDSLLKWGLGYAGRKQTLYDKVFYLGSKPLSEGNSKNNFKLAGELKNKFVVTFIGTFVENNDPSILVDCARRIKNENIVFVLAGDGELLKHVKEKSAGLKNIFFPGWLNQEEINILLKHSNVGVAPAKELRNAFPNKVFSYFSAGIPVLTAFEGDLKEILQKHTIGFYFPPNDVNALVNWILKLQSDITLYRKMCENTRIIFNEMFDAEKIYEEYAKHIEKISLVEHSLNIHFK